MRIISFFLISFLPLFISLESCLAQEPLKVGLIVPLSGEYASFGKAVVNAAQLAAEKGSGHEIELLYADNWTCSSQDAVSGFQKLVSVDHTKVIITFCTAAAKAVAPLAKRMDIPVFQLTEPGDAADKYMIKMMPTSYGFLDLLADVFSKKYARMAIVASSMEVNTGEFGNAPLFTRGFESRGGKIVFSEEFPPSLLDFRTMIVKIKSSGAQAVTPFIWDARQLATFMKQADELGLWGKVDLAGNFTFEMLYRDLIPIYPRLAKMNGLVSVNFRSTTSPDFIKEYREHFGEDAPQFADYAYDVVKIIRRCGLDRSCSLEPFEGASGMNRFDETGRRIGDFALKELRGGVFRESRVRD